MKRLEQMKESLISCVQGQISGNLQQVDAKELGEAIDMIKDLEEAIYYCTITKAMNEEESWEKKGHHQQQQQPPMYYQNMGREYYHPYPHGQMYNDGQMYNSGQLYMDGNRMYNNGAMYSNGGGNSGGGSSGGNSGGGNSGGNNARGGGTRGYQDQPMGYQRDMREGNSPMYRKMYMESKEMGQSEDKKMQDLENYIQELAGDIMEMVEQASPEEKQLLRQKITSLATKIK